MNNNFEKEVYYFIMLVFNNIQVAKTKKNKQKAIFSNLKFILDRKEIKIWNKEKKYSYTLYTNQIQNYNFKNHITKYLALIYIDKLTKYINKKITFEELANIDKNITPHKLRHSHAALLIYMGKTLEDIKTRLRHKDIRTTSNEYGHMYKERKISLANELTNFRNHIQETSNIVTPSETPTDQDT